MTVVFKLDPQQPDSLILAKAAEILRRGGIVAFPTETVYGLGAVVFNEEAVKKIFWAKLRPPDNPLIIHVCDVNMLNEVAVDIPDKARRLMEAFWPGPLTLILPRHPRVPKIVTSGLDTVAVRMPAHPVALGLIRETRAPIAAPSANLAGKPSPTSAEHVIRDLYNRIDAIIDAGETVHGVESTIIDILAEPPVLLRPGAYAVEDIEKVLGEKIAVPEFARGYREADIALAPGMKYRHYAPDTPLILVEPLSGSIESLKKTILTSALKYVKEGLKVCIVATRETASTYTSLPNSIILELGSRFNVFEIAKNLFKTLRSLDDLDCDVAVVEGVEERGLGLAVMNRLRKASKTVIKA
ncbi:MAG: L-threonylcarbamoyladenylate synthase [Desulfurococcaceae archaeon]